MIDVKKLLCEVCASDEVYTEGIDLYESGLLDSLAFIELLEALEDEGICINPTQVDRTKFHTVNGIEELIREYENEQ